MKREIAAVLVASLVERLERDGTLGSVSSLERQALVTAAAALMDDLPLSEPKVTQPVAISTISPVPEQPRASVQKAVLTLSAPPVAPPPEPRPELPVVTLDLASLERTACTDKEVLLCLDFGTAMSKAFASVLPNEYLDLELGRLAGGSGYALPSTVFIGDDGKAYFGFEAVDRSQHLADTGRSRVDSIKGWLSLRREGNLDGEACLLDATLNPTRLRLTQGDLIRFYLAFLTDTANAALSEYSLSAASVGRYVKRRFARPCWPDPVQAKWADALMRTLMAEAQILADTFRGKWAGGIDVAILKMASDQVRRLTRRPDYLIDAGVPEPVAVAAGAIKASPNSRDAYMVVDVGAGTTDFGLFIVTRKPDEDDAPASLFQISGSIQGLMQAGDKVDGMLRGYIARKEAIDAADTSGKLILADLSRRIRGLKEVLFKTEKLEYVLADGTIGTIVLADFLADQTVQKFAKLVQDGFHKSLEAVDDTWLKWLAMEGVRLHVVLTGGSSSLPMMKDLGKGVIEVKGYKILRKSVDPKPYWIDGVQDELLAVYPQLAVAIGGTADELPQTLTAPAVFAGGGVSTRWVGGNPLFKGN